MRQTSDSVIALCLCLLGAVHNKDRFLEFKADKDLFDNMWWRQHCVHDLLPPVQSLDNLGDRGHSFTLPDYSTNTRKKSIVICCHYLPSDWLERPHGGSLTVARGSSPWSPGQRDVMIVLVYCILSLFYCMIFVFSPGPMWYISYFYDMI